MFLIETYLDKSKIHNIGVFSDQNIKKDTIIWKYNPYIDITLDDNVKNHLNEVEKKFIDKYAYWDTFLDKHILSADNDRFTNHSDNPNTYTNENGEIVAKININKGEEITSNYYEIDKLADKKFNL
jgi:uncharacterized protein